MAGPFSLNDPISIGVGVGSVKFSNLITHLRRTIPMLRLTDYLDFGLFTQMKQTPVIAAFIFRLTKVGR